MSGAIGRWLQRRLQRKLAREWSEHQHPPDVSLGPFFRSRRGDREGTQVYRSIVQIHFHRR